MVALSIRIYAAPLTRRILSSKKKEKEERGHVVASATETKARLMGPIYYYCRVRSIPS